MTLKSVEIVGFYQQCVVLCQLVLWKEYIEILAIVEGTVEHALLILFAAKCAKKLNISIHVPALKAQRKMTQFTRAMLVEAGFTYSLERDRLVCLFSPAKTMVCASLFPM